MSRFLEKIHENNHHEQELSLLLTKAKIIFQEHFPSTVHFERSIFINWTCAIADCKYCYLSTKPKFNFLTGTTAIRSQESILAEVLICKAMNWEVGYITGGLRVESADYLIDLAQKINLLTEKRIIMNFGPYSKAYINKFQPHIAGMGCAIESFEEQLHNFICPSKPLKSLLLFLKNLQELKLQKLITIILGLGEKKEDVLIVIENIKKYNIEKIQLCFLKAQENTIFAQVPAPDPLYMAWWIANIRIACPTVQIKVALVKDRISDLSLYLNAGANAFTRFMVFKDFGSPIAEQLEKECQKAARTLIGNFHQLPSINITEMVDPLPLKNESKQKIIIKAEQYYRSLQSLKNKKSPLIIESEE